MGIFYIVATPIGNLEDITLRALKILENSDLILCEDTRTTGVLLKHYHINKPLLSLHDNNELQRLPEIQTYLEQGKIVSLVSENGTPLISDPGYKLTRDLLRSNHKVIAIPGPSSVITALVSSGLTPDKFFFVGFLPKKDGAFEKIAESIREHWQHNPTTIIALDSPHRILKNLDKFVKLLNDPYVVITRELTKKYEQRLAGRASELLKQLGKIEPKGEIVVLLNPINPFD